MQDPDAKWLESAWMTALLYIIAYIFYSSRIVKF